MSRIWLAGASGYIGSRVWRALEAGGAEVMPIARRSHSTPGIRAIDMAADPEGLASSIADFNPDLVVNCAGTISPDARTAVAAHVTATANLLDGMEKVHPGLPLVQLGSAAEYGAAVERPGLIGENTPPRPEGPYGISKLASTQLAIAYGRRTGGSVIVLRVFNLLGPDMPLGTVVARVLDFLSARPSSDTPIRTGRLDVYRDFVHVDDVVAAVVAATTRTAEGQPAVVNVAGGRPVLVRTLVRDMLDAAGHPGGIEEDAAGSTRSEGVPWQHADIARARERLGWTPTIGYRASLLGLVGTIARQRP